MLYVYRACFDSWLLIKTSYVACLDLGLKERFMLHVQCAWFHPRGGGGTAIYGPYGYVPLQFTLG